MKLRKGDKVKVIAGKHKGTVGEILTVFPKRERVTIDSVNVKKRTIKKSDSSTTENFIYIQHPIHVSNVRLVDDAGNFVKDRTLAATPKKAAKSTKKEAPKSAKKKTTKTKSS